MKIANVQADHYRIELPVTLSDSTHGQMSTASWSPRACETATVLINEISVIVEAYDYEPSNIPEDHRLVVLFRPDLRYDDGNIEYQSFKGEIRPTTNAISLLSSTKTAPIIINPGIPIKIGVLVNLLDTGTYRFHVSFDLRDRYGNKKTLDSSSFITRWAQMDEVYLSELEPIDVQ